MSEEHFSCMNHDRTASSPTTTGFQPGLLGDTDAHSRSAGMVTHGALLKSYNLNKKSMLPLAFLITPMAPQPSVVLRREPLRCQSCDAAFSLPAHLVPFSRCDGSARFATLVMHSRRLVTARYPSIRLLCPALSTLSRTSIPMQLRCSALPPSFFVSTEI